MYEKLIFGRPARKLGCDNCKVRRDKQPKKSILGMDPECAFIWFITNKVGLQISVNYLLYSAKYPLFLALLTKYLFVKMISVQRS